MSARLETETQSARNMLLDNLPALRQRLADHQIQLERFDVNWGGHSSGNLPQQPQDQTGRSPSRAGPPTALRNNPQAASASAQPAVGRLGSGRLDVVI